MVGLIAQEWIAPHGGSENVAEAMARSFPDADVTTLWNDAPERFAGHQVRESWLARTPLRRSKAAAVPFMSPTWSAVDVADYDFVLASSHVFAHHIGGRSAPRKFAYVHTPARTIWAPDQDARGSSVPVRALAPAFRLLDRRFVSPNTSYAANSEYIKQRIQKVWGMNSTVIYPPVDVGIIRSKQLQLSAEERELVDALPDGFVLGASRFVPYKRLDLVLAAAEEAGLPVVLAGSGPDDQHLRQLASALRVPVRFVQRPSDALLHELYRRASAFVFPAVEDFGIMPVEAMAAGTPVVVFEQGGASESVRLVDGGVVTSSLEAGAMARAILRAARMNCGNVPKRVQEAFGESTFHTRLRTWMSRDREPIA